MIMQVQESHSVNCGLLGNRFRCRCYIRSREAVCRESLPQIPFFGGLLNEVDVIDLRYNKITFINESRKEEFEMVELDLRKNPLNCSELPNWANIISDCKKKPTTTSSISFSTLSIKTTTSSESTTKSGKESKQSCQTEYYWNISVTPAFIFYIVGSIVFILRRKLESFCRTCWKKDHFPRRRSARRRTPSGSPTENTSLMTTSFK